MSRVMANPEYEVAYQDLCALISKHADKMTAAEILALAANMIGKLIALQDQRTMSRERAIKIVCENLEAGNAQILAMLSGPPAGTA